MEYKSEIWSDKEPQLHIFCSRSGKIAKTDSGHTHDFIEIIYVKEGSAEECVDDVTYNVTRGDLIFINYNSRHSFKGSEDFCFYNICFYPDDITDRIVSKDNAFALLSLTAFNELCANSLEGVVHFDKSERVEIENVLDGMLLERKDNLSMSQTVIESYMNVLMTKILRKTVVGKTQIVQNDVWNEVADYIENNLSKDLSLASLAKKCFYNPSYFCRMFKEKFDVSLTEYVNKKRIEKVIEYLTDTNMTVNMIAEEVGFSNSSVLYRTFQSVMGITLNEYRNSIK